MVTPETIATALGRSTPADGSPQFAQWSMWIADAYRAIERRATRLAVPYDSLNVEDVDFVVRESVVAHARNPESTTQVDTQIDDGRISKRYATSEGRIEIRADQWDELGLALPTEAFSIMTFGEPTPPPVVWP